MPVAHSARGGAFPRLPRSPAQHRDRDRGDIHRRASRRPHAAVRVAHRHGPEHDCIRRGAKAGVDLPRAACAASGSRCSARGSRRADGRSRVVHRAARRCSRGPPSRSASLQPACSGRCCFEVTHRRRHRHLRRLRGDRDRLGAPARREVRTRADLHHRRRPRCRRGDDPVSGARGWPASMRGRPASSLAGRSTTSRKRRRRLQHLPRSATGASKMLRVAMLLPVVMVLSLVVRHRLRGTAPVAIRSCHRSCSPSWCSVVASLGLIPKPARRRAGQRRPRMPRRGDCRGVSRPRCSRCARSACVPQALLAVEAVFLAALVIAVQKLTS